MKNEESRLRSSPCAFHWRFLKRANVISYFLFPIPYSQSQFPIPYYLSTAARHCVARVTGQ